MAARRSKADLRAVKPGETAPGPDAPPMSVTEAAEKGTQLDLLLAMRSRIAVAVEDVLTPARDLAALSRRLQDVSKEIEAIRRQAKIEAEQAEATGAVDETFDPKAV